MAIAKNKEDTIMYGNYYERRDRGFGVKAVLIFIGIAILIVTAIVAVNYYSEKTYTATVTDKDIKNYDSDSTFLVFTKTENGETRVFSMKDTLFKGRFNTADEYAEIEVGNTYTFTVIGWRIPFFSKYENIIKFQEKTD